MRIVQGVEDVLPTPLANLQPEMPQRTKLMRDARLLHAEITREHPDRTRTLLQPPEDQQAAGRGKHLHPLGNRLRQLTVERGSHGVTFNAMRHRTT